MKKIKLTRGKYALVDDKDHNWLNQWKWYTKFTKWTYYVVRDQHILGSGKNEIKKRIRMHRLIMDCPRNKVIDHKDHNGLNNQRSNLRIVTSSQNNMNNRLRSDNTSKFKGVTWDKEKKKWLAQLCINKKNINLGRFQEINQAIMARREAEFKYF